MDNLRKILVQIHEGKTSFRAEGSSKEELAAFQPIAKALIYAKQNGYLVDCLVRKSNRIGGNYYASAILRGGLSYAGQQFLKDRDSLKTQPINQQQASIAEDIIELKPNFFGFGINLNALLRRLWRDKT